MDPTPEPSAPQDLPPSKSQVKRDMHALLDLGRDLIALPASQLDQLPLSETLRDAIDLAQRTRTHEGLRRQTHYVGKLMRQADAPALRAQLDLWANGSQAQARAMQRIEMLRDRLMEHDEALTELLDQVPGLDIQALRTQIRAARKEMRDNAALPQGREPVRKHYRALFQTLKKLEFKDEAH